MKLLRSIASVLLSYIVVTAIVLISDPVLAHFFPGQYVSGKTAPAFVLWIGSAIFAVASIIGGWLCVRIAPSKPGAHLLALFILGEVAGVISTIVNWNKWPHWNSFVWLAIWPIFLWIGGRGRRADAS
jgi:nitrate/nitrite transporter NarK